MGHGGERAGAGARLRRKRDAIADLTASNPTRCGFTYPASLLDALMDPRALDYDPQPRGLPAARDAVCRYYADHAWRSILTRLCDHEHQRGVQLPLPAAL